MRGLTRVLLTVNFSLLILLIGPGSSRQLYLTEMKTRDSSYCCLLIAVLVYCFGCFVSGAFCLDSDLQIRREASTATHEAGLGALSRLVPRCFNFLLICFHAGFGRVNQTTLATSDPVDGHCVYQGGALAPASLPRSADPVSQT